MIPLENLYQKEVRSDIVFKFAFEGLLALLVTNCQQHVTLAVVHGGVGCSVLHNK